MNTYYILYEYDIDSARGGDMGIVQKQMEEVATNQILVIKNEFNVDNFSQNFVQQLNEITPCYLKEIVHLNLVWYVGAWLNDLFSLYPDEDATDIELVDYILERQPNLMNSRGVLEHVIAISHHREYPFPVDQEIVNSMSGADEDEEMQDKGIPQRRRGITNPTNKSKGRKRRYR